MSPGAEPVARRVFSLRSSLTLRDEPSVFLFPLHLWAAEGDGLPCEVLGGVPLRRDQRPELRVEPALRHQGSCFRGGAAVLSVHLQLLHVSRSCSNPNPLYIPTHTDSLLEQKVYICKFPVKFFSFEWIKRDIFLWSAWDRSNEVSSLKK